MRRVRWHSFCYLREISLAFLNCFFFFFRYCLSVWSLNIMLASIKSFNTLLIVLFKHLTKFCWIKFFLKYPKILRFFFITFTCCRFSNLDITYSTNLYPTRGVLKYSRITINDIGLTGTICFSAIIISALPITFNNWPDADHKEIS